MRLHLVSDGERRVWVAAESGEDMYAFVQNTGRFHRNAALGSDYFLGNRLSYRPIGATEARTLIAEGVGILGAEFEDLAAEFRADPAPLDVDTVLSAALAETD